MNKVISITTKKIFTESIDMYNECNELLLLIKRYVKKYNESVRTRNKIDQGIYIGCFEHAFSTFICTVNNKLSIKERISMYGKAQATILELLKTLKKDTDAFHRCGRFYFDCLKEIENILSPNRGNPNTKIEKK